MDFKEPKIDLRERESLIPFHKIFLIISRRLSRFFCKASSRDREFRLMNLLRSGIYKVLLRILDPYFGSQYGFLYKREEGISPEKFYKREFLSPTRSFTNKDRASPLGTPRLHQILLNIPGSPSIWSSSSWIL